MRKRAGATYAANTHDWMRFTIVSHIERMSGGIIVCSNNQFVANLDGSKIDAGSSTGDMGHSFTMSVILIVFTVTTGDKSGLVSVNLDRGTDGFSVLVYDGVDTSVVDMTGGFEEAAADGGFPALGSQFVNAFLGGDAGDAAVCDVEPGHAGGFIAGSSAGKPFVGLERGISWKL
jgi:hypothetical protein